MPEIFVRLKEPVDPKEYKKYEVEEYTVYLFEDAETEDTITIKLSDRVSDLPDQEIVVEGLFL
ncbi:hypothetical protein CLPU_12c00620 [Gottschalkia purinilytica]|uniref:Uncharacterized protein n=1 Tax=Gottschalkia purinilytica TaxID=1503 RepID=A0A0L0W8B1_GOTPU|nr:hypothetical protein [Gottschalkia purinilytica]KNF07789.1 hypothetical protein CLPU_12c00620 [Gottschalkia purinilytica]